MATPQAVDLSVERARERLRQEQATFNQHRSHENLWFLLRLVMGYSSVVMLAAVLVVSSYLVLNASSFPTAVISAAAAALFTDTLGLVVGIWKIVFNPGFMTRLAPVTQSDRSKSGSRGSADAAKNPLTVVSARYGAGDAWVDVAALIRDRVGNGVRQIPVANEELGGDPAPGVPKRLEVTYLQGDKAITTAVNESEKLSFPPDGKA